MAHETSPYRLRIPPASPRAHHVLGSQTFSKERGWYPIAVEDKARFEAVLLFDTSDSSPPLFQIVTAEQAAAIDRAEGRERSGKGTARNPINPATGLPDNFDPNEAFGAELAAVRAEAAGTKAMLAELLDVVVGGKAPSAAMEGHLQAALTRRRDADRAEADESPDSRPAIRDDDRPVRPGAGARGPSGTATAGGDTGPRTGPGTGPKGKGAGAKGKVDEAVEAKPVAGADGTADDPLGTKGAIEGVDQKLREDLAGRPAPR